MRRHAEMKPKFLGISDARIAMNRNVVLRCKLRVAFLLQSRSRLPPLKNGRDAVR